jgi:hypothetical protein
MDSTFIPQSIQAAQSVFAVQKAKQQAPAPPAGKSKKGTAKLGELATNSRTTDQAVIARQQSS